MRSTTKPTAALLRLVVLALIVVLGSARALADPGATRPAIAHLEDPTGKLGIEQVAAPEMAQRFVPASGQNLNFGFTDSAYWLRFTLPAGGAATLVALAIPYTDWLDFYRPRGDGGFDASPAGDRRPFTSQDFDYRYPVFRMTPSPNGETQFYLRASSSWALMIPLIFLSEAEFDQTRLADNLKFGLYFGLLLAMALYNLFLYFGVRDRAYLWYVVWVVSFGLFQTFHTGLALQWVLRDAPLAANYGPHLLMTLAMASLATFTRAVLGLAERAPRLDRLAKAVAWSGWAVLVSVFVAGLRIGTLLVNLYFLAALVVSALAAVVVWRRGYRQARYLLLAMGLLWSCGLIAGTYLMFPLPGLQLIAHYLAYDGMLIASSIEALLFAFALADRINLLKKARERAQTEALRSQGAALAAARRSEQELEQRVAERTQALAQAKDEALQANLAKTRFLAAASHDLRQPMHAIGLLVGALRERVGESEAKRLAEKVEASVEAMDGLFNALLDISKLDSGAVTPKPTQWRLQSLFERLELSFAPQAQAKGLKLRIRKTSALVRSDPVLLDRILSNLVTNSLRYTNTGGVLVAARPRGQSVRIEVWDTGVGIPADKQAMVFEEFVQLDTPARDRAKGLGLGLSIVKRLAALLEHPLALRSRPGRGTVFSVTVPFSGRALPLAATENAAASEANLQGAFVVVIDDEEDIREGMRVLLGSFGSHVLCAGSGPAAVAALAEHLRLPDLIISDYRLACDHSGVDAIAMIREMQQADIPALLITGDASVDDLDRVLTSGLPVLFKPVSAARLRSVMAAAIGDGARALTSVG